MNNTTKICLTVAAVAWLAGVVGLAIAGQTEVAVTLAVCGMFAGVMIAFFFLLA